MTKDEYYLTGVNVLDELVQQEFGGDFCAFRAEERHEMLGC